jgi:arginine deiminase
VVKKDLAGAHVRTDFKHSLLDALRDEGVDLEPIFCGGHGDRIAQAREQWTDGANAFCLAPGAVCLYERNERTLGELADHGYAVVRDLDLVEGRERLALDGRHKTVVTIGGSELSRARGGPRCLTMPLVREALR